MATLYKRGEIWWARWYRQDGHRVQSSTKTTKRREAERIAGELESEDRKAQLVKPTLATEYERILRFAAGEAQRGTLTTKRAEEYLLAIRRVGDPDYKVMTLEEALKDWWADQEKRVSESTSKGYNQMIDAVGKAAGNAFKQPLTEFSHLDAKRLLHKLKDGRTAATANQHFRAFRRALQAAVRAKMISDNPAEGVRSLPEDDSAEKAPFTKDEVSLMLSHPKTSEEWRGCILIAAHTGLRLGDVVGLSRAHIDGDTIVIRPKKTSRGKKTLYVPLSPPVKAWIGDRKGHFFPTLGRSATGVISTQFKRLMAHAGVRATLPMPGGIIAHRSFHSLRHSFTSWLANADIQADVRQKLTGHSSAGIHAIYTHHDESLKRAIDKLPRL